MPASRKVDQSAPKPVSATGATNGSSHDSDPRAQSGDYLTTAQGLRLPDTDHSLKVGARGPTLLEDFHLREKITHFDHERIPERVVHARGAAAHGVFESYGTAASVTKAGFLGKKGTKTEVFTRFSTVLGSRGSADTLRDTRVVAGGTTATGDITLVALLQEAFRHCKAIAAWGDGAAVGEDVDKTFTANLAAALGLYRAWDRAPTVMASAVPPAGR
jgi:hypothetical protein